MRSYKLTDHLYSVLRIIIVRTVSVTGYGWGMGRLTNDVIKQFTKKCPTLENVVRFVIYISSKFIPSLSDKLMTHY